MLVLGELVGPMADGVSVSKSGTGGSKREYTVAGATEMFVSFPRGRSCSLVGCIKVGKKRITN